MARNEEEEITWGTWEELLLAFAVKRHGTNNWESVANEILSQKKKMKKSNFTVTPHNCKLKYHHLHRRFNDIIDSDHNNNNNNNVDENVNHRRIPWLDELRKLRVAELRREVQQYDVSIVSLQLKVQRLKEEREQSLKSKDDDAKPDLLVNRAKEMETRPPSLNQKADGPVSGHESDRGDNLSFNESNSSDLKHVKNPEAEIERIPVQTVTEKQDADKPPLGEDSCNGSSETIARDADSVAKETAVPVGEPAELWESGAESESGGNGEEGTKDNSDGQSSASLSRRNRRRRDTAGSSSRETDEISPAIKSISVKSEPLLGILEMVLSHKFGSVFKSRLESQQTIKYKGLIRQHIDMETIQTRLKEGSYSGGCGQKFFRDLLLLFNNAIAFYPKHSSESVAATELRELVSKEILLRTSGSSSSRSQNNPSPGEVPTPKLQQSATPPLLKPDRELSDSLLPRTKSVGALAIACRKRSSISAKAANSSKQVELKGWDQKIAEEKPVLDKKQNENSSAVEGKIVFSRRTGERSASGTRRSRSNFKKRNNNITDKISSENTNSNSKLDPSSAPKSAKGGSGDGDETNLETKTEKDKKNNSNYASTSLTNTVAKKRSVGDVKEFLNRMKKTSSSSNNGKLLETIRNSAAGHNSDTTKGEKGGSIEEKHLGSGSKKDGQVTRQSSSKRRGSSQESSPAKRGVGRPPKKGPQPSSSKRTREGEKEVEPEVKAPRKRTRR